MNSYEKAISVERSNRLFSCIAFVFLMISLVGYIDGIRNSYPVSSLFLCVTALIFFTSLFGMKLSVNVIRFVAKESATKKSITVSKCITFLGKQLVELSDDKIDVKAIGVMSRDKAKCAYVPIKTNAGIQIIHFGKLTDDQMNAITTTFTNK